MLISFLVISGPKNLSLRKFITVPPLCWMRPMAYAVQMRSMLRHFLSFAYSSNAASILRRSSAAAAPGFPRKAPPRHLARVTPSSKAAQPPCPRSGVMAWSASPATQTLPLQTPPQRRSQGHRNLKGEETMALGSVLSTACNTFLGAFRRLRRTYCFIFAMSSSTSFSVKRAGRGDESWPPEWKRRRRALPSGEGL